MSRTDPLTVAVQGELGSNSHVAARAFFAPEAPAIHPCRSFADLFAAIADGSARFAMAPVDNSLAGTIHEVWDLFSDESPSVHGELYLRIRHCLIARPGVTLDGIGKVFSHPQALAQCGRFLGSLDRVEAVEEYDTAGAVELIAAGNDDGHGAIAPAEAAVTHGMAILAEDIQDCHDNFTRFLVIGAETADSEEHGRMKSSLLVRLGHSARRLSSVLNTLGDSSLDVVRVESRKLREPWEYLFYVDVEGVVDGDLLERLRAETLGISLIGPYPADEKVEPGSGGPGAL